MFCYMHVPMLSTLFINVYTLPTILGKVSFSYMIRVRIEARLFKWSFSTVCRKNYLTKLVI